MLLALSVPAGYERGPLAAEQFLTTFHQADLHRGGIELIIGNRGRINGLFIRCSSTLKTIVERQLYAAYPEAMLTELPDDALSPPAGSMTWSMCFGLTPICSPARTITSFLTPIVRLPILLRPCSVPSNRRPTASSVGSH